MKKAFKILCLIVLFIALTVVGRAVSVVFTDTGSAEYRRNKPFTGIVIMALGVTVFAGLKLFDSGEE